MKNTIISARNKIERFFYVNLFKPVFFLFDPEDTHYFMTNIGIILGNFKLTQRLTSLFFDFKDPILEQNIHGVRFPNPIGLAAGFDKNALLTDILPPVGFGFMEVGSITAESCKGNDRPRLWRLKNSGALVVNYGLKNDGCEKIAKRLQNRNFDVPLGTSIAKTNSKETCETENGVQDYVRSFKRFADIGQYFTINISCPNAYGGEPFTDPIKLERLLTETDKIETKKPIFLKISPDLINKQVDDILDVCARHRIHGFICSNLTKDRNNPKIKDETPKKGGISGKVSEELANKQIRYIYNKTGGKYIIIGCGGVFTADDAYKKIKAGASLIQLITGMIFEGPQAIGEINRGLVELLKKDGYKNISGAVGAEIKKY